MSKTIPQLNTVPGGVTAANLFFEVARQITAGNFNGESEKIAGDALLSLFAGTSLTLNIIQRLNPTGVAYNPATTYTLYDYLDVAYQDGHYAYINPAPSAGHLPTDSAYWLLISSDGADGADGASGLTQTQADARYPLKTDPDPYPTYLTQAEAAALFSPLGGDAQGGLRYALSLATTSPPSSGQVRFNNAAIASVTQIFIHESDRNSAAQSEILDAIALGTRLQVALESNEEIYAWFRVSGAVVDNGSNRTIPVTFISSAGTFVAEEVTLSFLQIQGVAPGGGGATGIKFTLNTSVGTPAAGEIRSSGLSSGGTVLINPTDAQTKSVSDILDRLKVGAIVEIAKDANNRVRGTITTEYTVASGSFAIGSVRDYGSLANSDTVYLSISSAAPSVSSGTGISGGSIAASVSGDTITLSQVLIPSGLWPPLAYSWYRASIPGFALSEATVVAGAANSGLADSGLTAGSYYYRRVATDQLGVKIATPEAGEAIYDADTIAGINAVEATGATLTTAQKNAANTRILAHKSEGTWTALEALYLYLGGTAAAHAVNWKTPGTFTVSWAGGVTHSANGVTGDGATGYGLTGLSTQASRQNSNAAATYLKEVTSQGMLYGSFNTGQGSLGIFSFPTGASSHSFYTNSANSNTDSATIARTGALLASRNISTTHKFFRNGVLVSTQPLSSGTGQSGGNMAILARRATNDDSIAFFVGATIGSTAFFIRGVTDAEGLAYTNTDLAFQNELGRN